MNLVWRHNGSALITAVIFQEWLVWFDRRMHDRKVVLVMDNFSAHEAAVEAFNERLQNTLII